LRRIRAWLRASGPVRLLDDCAALMLIETGAETEDDLRRVLEAHPSLIQRIAIRVVLRSVQRQQRAQAESSGEVPPVEPAPAQASQTQDLHQIA
jgi:phosphatidate phosphatase APP1